jgi:hypothetical protein
MRSGNNCIAFVLIFFSALAAYGKSDIQVRGENIPPHPRLLMIAGEEEEIKKKIASDPFLEKAHRAIMERSDEFLSESTLTYEKTGKRLLAVARSAFRQIYFLSYSFRMTGDKRYAHQALRVIHQVCAFPDWNPSHYLDVAEMTSGVAIGYDWLYDQIDERSRQLIRKAIIEKGIGHLSPDAIVDPNDLHWLTKTNNWNAVCNGGMILGSLAVFEDEPSIAGAVLARSIASLKEYGMRAYAPDGNYPEGYMYWHYGTGFAVLAVDALEKAMGSSFGLASSPGFMETGRYVMHVSNPGAGYFAYSDCVPSREEELSLPSFWFASRTGDTDLLWNEWRKFELAGGKGGDMPLSRYLPALVSWAAAGDILRAGKPEERLYAGHGETPVAIMRSKWGGADAIFAGLKGGSASNGHAHMDAGTFVLTIGSDEWVTDPGSQDYYSLEKHGIDLHSRAQDSERWKVYRCGPFSHNLVMFADSLQRVDGHARIVRSGESPGFVFAMVDLTSVNRGLTANHLRGVAIRGDSCVVVRDEIENKQNYTPIRWAMLTSAEVRITGERSATLSMNGRVLHMEVRGGNPEMRIWSTEPEKDYEASNEGTVMAGFTDNLFPGERVAFDVLLVPGTEIEPQTVVQPLSMW